MKCPNCENILQITERQNVEIDYCPNCRGVWLDKGELDKIIDFANQQLAKAAQKNTDNDEENYKAFSNNEYKNSKYKDERKYADRNYKKKSFLGDLFDFG